MNETETSRAARRFAANGIRALLLTGLLLLLAGSTVAAKAPRDRLGIVLMGFADQTSTPDAGHWRHVVHSALLANLDAVQSIRVIPDSEAAYALRRLGLEATAFLEPQQARQIAQLIHARKVIWGSYTQDHGTWTVKGQVLDAGGNEPTTFEASGPDWPALLDALTGSVLNKLDVTPSAAERAKMRARSTSSAAALEYLGRGFAAYSEGKPAAELAGWARKAVSADPTFARAHAALAANTANRAEAEQALHTALKLRPDYAWAHRALGDRLFQQNRTKAALKEFQAAVRFDPDDADNLCRLAEFYISSGKQNEAIGLLEKASCLAPSNLKIRCRLGERLASQGRRVEALAKLNSAEELESVTATGAPLAGVSNLSLGSNSTAGVSLDLESEAWFVAGYGALEDAPKMISHFETFASAARQRGVAPGKLEEAEKRIQELRLRQVAHRVVATMPKRYTDAALDAALRGRLTPNEMRLVVNPLASTPAMRQWAEQLSRGATNDMDKARRIFDALIQRPASEVARLRTAKEIFADWNKPREKFCCQDYTKLFIALGREVGLDTFYAHLERDYADQPVAHDCPVLFAEGQAWLVDAAYRWFGAPHRGYVLLDDLQVIAHQLYETQGTSRDLECRRAAAKLHPDIAWGQLRLALACAARKQWAAAQEAAAAASRLEPNRWEAYLLQGQVAIQAKEFSQAAAALQKATQLKPDNGEAHFCLATALWNCKPARLDEALAEYRAAVGLKLDAGKNRSALQAIKEISRLLGEKAQRPSS